MAPEENKKEIPTNFGKVIDILHNKSKLPSLRTYQGDMAEFIKEKNESVISVAVKEKEREEKREEQKEEKEEAKKTELPKFETEESPKPKTSNFQINFTMLFLSIFLIVGGVATLFYIYKFIDNGTGEQIEVNNVDIIPYNESVTLANITKANLGGELVKLSPSDGVNLAKMSDAKGNLINTAQEFFNFLDIPANLTLRRTLQNGFAVGTISQNNIPSPFLIITVEDFGRAFASMLDWESEMGNHLHFLTNTTTNSKDTFLWKDLIIKNKDARAFINDKGNAQIAYTFLDKNTILITSNILVIGEISDLYHSRAVAR